MLLKNRKGFILFDLLLTLSTILLFLSIILPSAISLIKYQEQQEYYFIAEELYNNLLKSQTTVQDVSVQKPIIYKNKEFTLNINPLNSRVLEYCISWNNVNNYEESLCRYAPIQ